LTSSSETAFLAMALLTPEQVIQGTAAEYGIVWDLQRDSPDNIVPHEVYGSHCFAEASRSWKFDFGQGCVGRAYAKHEVLIVEDTLTGDAMFLRKNMADKHGISTVAFVPQADGSILEVGFGRKLNELPQSWWMRNILECYANGSAIDTDLHDIHRMRTPSPASCLNAQSPSLRALARVACGINKSVEMLPPHSQASEEDHTWNSARNFTPSSISDRVSDASWGPDSSWDDDDEEEEDYDENKESKGKESMENAEDAVAEVELASVDEVEAGQLNQDAQCPSKPIIRVDLVDHVPDPPMPPMSFQRLRCNDTFANKVVPSYDAYQPSYLRRLQAVCSVGSVGHPYFCEGACKYMKTARGCKLGSGCDRCHLCLWTRASEREVEQRKKLDSAGSVGHPHFCGGACKYFTRKECKQGIACDRCHVCVWTRSGERSLIRRKNVYFDDSVGQPRFCSGDCKWNNQEGNGIACNHCHMSF
jgi:hypothetical protein